MSDLLNDIQSELPSVSCSEGDDLRFLHLGDTPWVQGCMRLRRPYTLELDYVQRMMAWLLWHDVGDPQHLRSLHAVQLGLGAAALTKFCSRQVGCKTTAVEINEQVIAACRLWFALPPDDAQLQVLWGDANEWVHYPDHAQTVDALMVDLYDQEAQGPVLDSVDFYSACRQVLRDEGITTINLFGHTQGYAQSLARIKLAFGKHNVLAFKPTREGNVVVLAMRQARNVDAATLTLRCDVLKKNWKLPAAQWLSLLKPA